MAKLEIFDPPMCCSSGVCGTNVDTKLVTFANDIEWLKQQGIDVVRYGLAFEPAAFASNETVKKALEQEGNDCLPLVLCDNEVVFKGGYPDRKKLAEICGVEFKPGDNSIESTPATTCGPECDCHKSAVSDNSKRILFIVIILIIAAIIAFKAINKVHAAEVLPSNIINVKATSTQLGQSLASISELQAGKDISFVFIPSKTNKSISPATKSAALGAQKILQGKNIKVNLYTLKTTSPDYKTVASTSKTPAILVIKGNNKQVVSGKINETRLLQAYVAVNQADCGAGCPCHKK